MKGKFLTEKWRICALRLLHVCAIINGYCRKAQYCLSPKIAVPTLTIVERHCTAI